MPEANHTNLLLEKLELLLKRQEMFSKEIDELRKEIYRLQTAETAERVVTEPEPISTPAPAQEPANPPVTVRQLYAGYHEKKLKSQPVEGKENHFTSVTQRSNLEKFIGENLINKIGIIITVIGVGIGTKYSIDHQLISPLTRIILGYFMGLGLLFFGIKLKKKYLNYSAVLVSGAIAILYFITYSAYSFYALLPQTLAFILMFVFTALMVFSALYYNRQVIAYIGAIGAYAVPFLLSDGSGKVVILFSYITIINIGIISVALKKYWKPLYYSAFVLTWLIYLSWYIAKYEAPQHYTLALAFAVIFLITFYAVFLGYKLIRKQRFDMGDIMLLLSNAFIFYAIGYAILTNDRPGENVSGAFTLANAALHFFVSLVIYGRRGEDKNLFYMVGGLALVFITIAIPVQLNGNWVTLLWAFEAALLFWIGRTKKATFYEILSYGLLFLAFFSLIQDWVGAYSVNNVSQTATQLTPLFNIDFLTSALCIASFSFINYINQRKEYITEKRSQEAMAKLMQLVIPAVLLVVLYFSFELELSNYWKQAWAHQQSLQSRNEYKYQAFENSDLYKFRMSWVINYSMLFFAILGFVNNRKIKNNTLGWVNLCFSVFFVFAFLTQGLRIVAELRETYLANSSTETGMHLGIRYISLVFLGGILFSIYQFVQRDFVTGPKKELTMGVDLFLHLSFICIISSELIAWMDLYHFSNSDKLTISIAWGIYALFLIIRGIWKKKIHLRVGAIILLLVTLIKLFFYDIAGLDNITKTIVFVSLGILLLIISFLYNKYGLTISGENEKAE